MTETGWVLIWTVLLGLLFSYGVRRQITSRRRLRAWAAANGLEIIRFQERPVLRGPFFWNSTNAQMVFFVVDRARDGTERSGFVRLGGFFLGMLTDRVDVVWR